MESTLSQSTAAKNRLIFSAWVGSYQARRDARFEVVRDTFSSCVGQICNAALDRSIIAYNENLNLLRAICGLRSKVQVSLCSYVAPGAKKDSPVK